MESPLSLTTQMTNESYRPLLSCGTELLFTMLDKVVLTVESVDKSFVWPVKCCLLLFLW